MTDWNRRYKSIVKVDGFEKFTSDLFVKAGSAWGVAMDYIDYWALGSRGHDNDGKMIAILKDYVDLKVIDTVTGEEVDPFVKPKKRHLRQVLTMRAGDDSVTVELNLESRVYTAKMEVSGYVPAQIQTENAMEALNWAIEKIDYYMNEGNGNIPLAFTS